MGGKSFPPWGGSSFSGSIRGGGGAKIKFLLTKKHSLLLPGRGGAEKTKTPSGEGA